MDPNRLTQKSQAAFSEAQNLAISRGNQQVDTLHLLHALATQDGGLVPQILGKCGLDAKAYAQAVEAELGRLPSVSGPGAQPGQVHITQAASAVLVRADETAKRMQDEFVSVEHLFLAMLDEPPSSGPGKVNRQFGLTRDKFLQALTEVRGNQRVTSDNPEGTYDSLKKYGRDLVDEARAASSTRSSGATLRSGASSASSRAAPRTTPCSSARRAWARRPTPKASPSAS